MFLFPSTLLPLFCTTKGGKELLSNLWPQCPKLAWIHSRSAGVEHLLLPELVECGDKVALTNARGLFSSSLAEHAILSCLYYAKDVDRWKRQQKEKKWEKYVVDEILGATMGVIGYGDIGQACAQKAKALGMKVIAQRRRPELSEGDGIAHEVVGNNKIGYLIENSDYVVVAAALTPATKGMVGAEQLAQARPHTVIINIGRGPLIDEEAMIAMLQDGRLRGAALDVFCTEPLPKDSALWDMENVLLSPHNTDLTSHFLHDSVRKFVQCMPGFITGNDVDIYVVDKKEGY